MNEAERPAAPRTRRRYSPGGVRSERGATGLVRVADSVIAGPFTRSPRSLCGAGTRTRSLTCDLRYRCWAVVGLVGEARPVPRSAIPVVRQLERIAGVLASESRGAVRFERARSTIKVWMYARRCSMSRLSVPRRSSPSARF
jgi:hypothetical protein